MFFVSISKRNTVPDEGLYIYIWFFFLNFRLVCFDHRLKANPKSGEHSSVEISHSGKKKKKTNSDEDKDANAGHRRLLLPVTCGGMGVM